MNPFLPPPDGPWRPAPPPPEGTISGAVGAFGPDGFAIAVPQRVGFWARITGVSGGLYSFVEVQDVSTGSTYASADVAGGMTGTAAREVNNDTTVATDTVVWMWQSEANEQWTFMGPGAGGGGGGTFSGARFIGPTTTTVPTSTYTTLTPAAITAFYDTDGYTNAFAAPTAGFYAGNFQVQFPTGASTSYGLKVISSSGNITAFLQTPYITATPFYSNGADLQIYFEGNLLAGETVSVQAWQTSGGNWTVSLMQQTIHRLGA